MTTGHLIADCDLTLLSNIADNALVYTCAEFVAVLTSKYLYINNYTSFTMWNLKRIVTNFSCLFTENSTKKSFFSCELSLTLRSNLTNKDITGSYLRTDTDDTILIEICKSIITDIWNIASYLLWSELCVTALNLVLFYMN